MEQTTVPVLEQGLKPMEYEEMSWIKLYEKYFDADSEDEKYRTTLSISP